MKTIKINGKTMCISAATERALRILKHSSFAAPKSEFEEGRGRYKTTCLSRHDCDDYGIEYRSRTNHSTQIGRQRRFFDAHPRHREGVFGNPRRINAILRSLDVM